MKRYLTTAMNGRTDTEECSAFLFIIGPKNREIFNTMTIIVEEDRKKGIPRKKTYISWCDQRGNNNPWTMQCVTGLRIISKNFRFDTIEDDILRDIIACGVHSKNVKETSQRQ